MKRKAATPSLPAQSLQNVSKKRCSRIDTTPLTDKQKERVIKNRQAANRSRMKREQALQESQQQNQELLDENQFLKGRVTDLESANGQLQKQMALMQSQLQLLLDSATLIRPHQPTATAVDHSNDNIKSNNDSFLDNEEAVSQTAALSTALVPLIGAHQSIPQRLPLHWLSAQVCNNNNSVISINGNKCKNQQSKMKDSKQHSIIMMMMNSSRRHCDLSRSLLISSRIRGSTHRRVKGSLPCADLSPQQAKVIVVHCQYDTTWGDAGKKGIVVKFVLKNVMNKAKNYD